MISTRARRGSHLGDEVAVIAAVVAHQPLEIVDVGREGVDLVVDELLGSLGGDDEVGRIQHAARGNAKTADARKDVVAQKTDVPRRFADGRALRGHVFIDVQRQLLRGDGEFSGFHAFDSASIPALYQASKGCQHKKPPRPFRILSRADPHKAP